MDENTTTTDGEPETTAVQTAVDGGDNGGTTDGGNDGGGDGVFSPDDALLERAVKAGMSLGDARSFGSREMAERFIGMLEAKNGKGGDNGNAGGEGDGEPTIDFGGFSEEDGYDPNIVKAMNSLKGVIEAQAKTIKELKAGRTAGGVQKGVETRKNLILAKPGGERGRSGASGKGDAEADAIASLRRRFKLN